MLIVNHLSDSSTHSTQFKYTNNLISCIKFLQNPEFKTLTKSRLIASFLYISATFCVDIFWDKTVCYLTAGGKAISVFRSCVLVPVTVTKQIY